MENFTDIALIIFSRSFKVILILVLALITKRFLKILISKATSTVTKINSKLNSKEIKDADNRRKKTLEKVANSLVNVFIWIIVILMILSELGVNIAPLLAGVGILGLAIGMGANQLIKDYLSGLFILIEDQYRVGEEIEMAGVRGEVKDFNLRRTVLEDKDNVSHYIDNSQVSKVSNFSRKK